MILNTSSAQSALYALCGKNEGFRPFTGGCYLGLFKTVPNDNGTGGEEVATPGNNTKNYARFNIAADTQMMNSVYNSVELGRATTLADRRVGNVKDINFNAARNTTLADPTQSGSEADWGTVKGFGIYTAATGGTLVGWSALAENQQVPVPANTSFHFYAGFFELYIDDAGNIAANAVAAAEGE